MSLLPAMAPVTAFMPWPYDETGAREDGLDFSAKIEGPGGWFDLEDGVHYAVHGDSFAAYSVTWRKNEINSQWIEGSFPVSAIKENVTEPLVIWVRGSSAGDERKYRDQLIAAIEQLSWQLMVRFEDIAEYWQCWASDYAVETQKEFLHARLSVVRVTVSRLPTKTVVDATSDEQ